MDSDQRKSLRPILNGQIKRFRIRSSIMPSGIEPMIDDIVEQRLTIMATGDVRLASYQYRGKNEQIQAIPAECFRIDPKHLKTIITAVSEYFSGKHQENFTSDDGIWILTLTNEDGEEIEPAGSLLCDLQTTDGGLSEIIRSALGRKDLLLFDGNPDQIEWLEVRYQKTTRVNLGYVLLEDKPTYDLIKEKESLVLDRKAEKLTYCNEKSDGRIFSAAYAGDHRISMILDNIKLGSLFTELDKSLEPEEQLIQQKYIITLVTKQKGKRVFQGIYKRDSLPAEWPILIRDIRRILGNEIFGELLSERKLGRTGMEQTDLMIFCNVMFDEYGKTYCYLADSDEYEEGDLVVVPVGPTNRETIATIESVEIYTAEEAPYPVDKIKRILRKYDKDEY